MEDVVGFKFLDKVKIIKDGFFKGHIFEVVEVHREHGALVYKLLPIKRVGEALQAMLLKRDHKHDELELQVVPGTVGEDLLTLPERI